MKRHSWWRLIGLTGLGLGMASVANPGMAAYFTNTEIAPNQVIAIASPYGRGAFQLLILQQVKNTQPCWREISTTEVDPLLLNFDFTGICERSTDSNGYSIRVGGQDLGYQYRLSVLRQENGLRLVAVSNADRSLPPIEIGRVDSIPNGFGKITLNPGWRLTKRVFNGRVLGHFYLTNEQGINQLIAAAIANPNLRSPGLQPTPVVSYPVGNSVPVSPLPVVNIPATPSAPPPIAAVPQLPPPPGSPTYYPSNNAPIAVPAPPPAVSTANPPIREIEFSAPSILQGTNPTNPISLGFNYRVLVAAPTRAIQDQVRKIVPDAFRVFVNGRTMMQAGLFQERQEAEALQQRFQSQNLSATVILLNGGRASLQDNRL